MAARRRVSEERLYYSPPAMRRYQQQQLQQQQQQQQLQQQQQPQLKLNSSFSSPSLAEKKAPDSGSYLDRFLEKTTPFVAAEHFSRTTTRAWRNRGTEFPPYYILGDLWEAFKEASAYGVGVPLLWDGCDPVVQYYVPSLSAIQLYIDPSSRVDENRPGEESDANSSQESSSERESECGTANGAQYSRECWNQKNSVAEGYSRPAGRKMLSVGSSGDGNNICTPTAVLAYEYFERELPYHREPLADKISILASQFPELKTYRSCDLAPSSWISVAWYPIYRIPVGPTLQNVDACFLTFHSIAKPVRSDEGLTATDSRLSLPAFGLVSYKFKISDLSESGGYESQKVHSLTRAADNWLRRLQVNHHDFNFFMANTTVWR